MSQQDLDNAKAALDVAEAKLAVSQKALDLAVAGPRKEDIGQAEAELRADEAQAAFLRQQLADAQLLAPVDAVVRTRLMEPGEMASPQKPVFSLAVTDPKWVRAYVAEPDLGKLRHGHGGVGRGRQLPATALRRAGSDSSLRSPNSRRRRCRPTELRTSLVYEVRVFVKDPSDELRLGSPATVYLPTNGDLPSSGTSSTSREHSQ